MLRLVTYIVVLILIAACSADAPSAPAMPESPQQPAPAVAALEPPMTEQPVPAPPLPAAPPAPSLRPVEIGRQAVSVAKMQAPGSREVRAKSVSTPIPASFPVTVESGDGSEVTFESPPERIVAFDSAVVEILFAIGEGDRVVGTHQYVDYPPEVADVARVGDAFNMDIEATVALEPDLVFVFFDRFVEDLERVGLKVLYVPTITDDFTRIAGHIRMWGAIVGNPESAERVALDFETRVRAIEALMDPIGGGPVVFQDVGGFWTPGRGTMIQEVFDLLRLENAAADIEGYAQLSPEVIVEKDPVIVLTSDPEGFASNPAFADIYAVRNGTIYSLSSNALSVQGPRFLDGVEELASIVYPGLFK